MRVRVKNNRNGYTVSVYPQNRRVRKPIVARVCYFDGHYRNCPKFKENIQLAVNRAVEKEQEAVARRDIPFTVEGD